MMMFGPRLMFSFWEEDKKNAGRLTSGDKNTSHPPFRGNTVLGDISINHIFHQIFLNSIPSERSHKKW